MNVIHIFPVRSVSVLLLACLLAAPPAAWAKTNDQRLAWQQLPSNLVGRKVTVGLKGGKTQKGTVARVDAAGIALSRRGGEQAIARGEVASIAWTERKSPRWSIVGAAAGAAPGIVLTGWAAILAKNEGGNNSNRNVGIAVGILAGGAVLGALAGRSADADRYVINITGQ